LRARLFSRSAALTALLFVAFAAAAQEHETRYVTDILQLGLFDNRNATGQPLRNLVSGTELTVLERIPNFAFVRTPAGEEGWVKSAFLVSDKPAQLRVAEVETRIAALEQERDQAITARDSAAADTAELVARAERELAAARADRDTLARLQQENDAFEVRMERYRGALPWPWVAGALVVVLGAGFFAGYWWLDASIRRRHGGFRVY
jgi:SH3 domain protein